MAAPLVSAPGWMPHSRPAALVTPPAWCSTAVRATPRGRGGGARRAEFRAPGVERSSTKPSGLACENAGVLVVADISVWAWPGAVIVTARAMARGAAFGMDRRDIGFPSL